jgi:hypothetical protein
LDIGFQKDLLIQPYIRLAVFQMFEKPGLANARFEKSDPAPDRNPREMAALLQKLMKM